MDSVQERRLNHMTTTPSAIDLAITPADLEALDAVFTRAQEDWLTYRNSGHGPSDFSGRGEWKEHCNREDGYLDRVSNLIKYLRQRHDHATR